MNAPAGWLAWLRGFVRRWAELTGRNLSRMPRTRAAIQRCSDCRGEGGSWRRPVALSGPVPVARFVSCVHCHGTGRLSRLDDAPDFVLLLAADRVDVLSAEDGAVLGTITLPSDAEIADRADAARGAYDGDY